MRRYLTIVLVLINLLLLLNSCSTIRRQGYAKSKTDSFKFIPIFNSDFTKALYKADISLNKRAFTSLVFIKRITENNSLRMVLLSEAGLKYFDFEFFPDDSVIVHYAIDFLNKKALIKTLTNDFKLIFKQVVLPDKTKIFVNSENTDKRILRLKQNGKKDYYFIGNSSGADKIDRKGCLLKRTTISISGYENNIPEIITINHVFPKFSIEMERINYQQ